MLPFMRHSSVARRLYIALGVFLLIVAAVAIERLWSSYQTATTADRVETEAANAATLVELNSALFTERITLEEFIDQGAEGDIEVFMTSARTATDRAFAATAQRPFSANELDRVRRLQNAGELTVAFSGRYSQLADNVDAEARQHLARALAEDAPSEVTAQIEALSASLAASTAAFDALVELSRYRTAQPFEEDFIRSELVAAMANFEAAAAQLDEFDEGEVGFRWRAMRPTIRRVRRVVDDISRGDLRPLAENDDDGLIEVRDVASKVAEVAGIAAEQTATTASEYRSEARQGALITSALAALLALTAAIFMRVLIRSIIVPLRSLADRARLVADGGAFERIPEGRSDPEELHLATGAFNDLVGNLEATGQKIMAIGAGELHDPVLDQPLPGARGRRLQESFDQLSEATRDRNRLEATLRYEATHDHLTGLLNRSEALRRIDKVEQGAQFRSRRAVVILYELAAFKIINDVYGNVTGDEVLLRLSQRLQRSAPPGAFVARIGGDEFAVVTAGTITGAEARSMASEMLATISAPYVVNGLNVSISAVCGIGLGDTRLLAEASLAARSAKRAGSGTTRLFDDAARHAQQEYATLEHAVENALEGGTGLSLVYQPILSPDGATIQGLEALLRFTDPTGSSVSAERVIEVAESSGLIVRIGQWVLRETLQQLAIWAEHPILSDVVVSLNASRLQIVEADFVVSLLQQMDQARISPSRLMVEVTETALVRDLRTAAASLDELRSAGVTVALDDFGSGFTSLSQLRTLPIDRVKLDKSMIDNIATSEHDAALAATLIELAKILNLDVVAEGVETGAQRDVLERIGCDRLQGYFFARPMIPADTEAFIAGLAARNMGDPTWTNPPEGGNQIG